MERKTKICHASYARRTDKFLLLFADLIPVTVIPCAVLPGPRRVLKIVQYRHNLSLTHRHTFVYMLNKIDYITDSPFTTKTLKFAAAGPPNVISTLYLPGNGNVY